jgi:HEAT repeat protein
VDLSSHVDDLVAALSHPDPAVREEAAGILAGIEPPPTQAVPHLVDALLQDAVISVREAAERTLRRMGTSASDASGRLLPALLTGDREQRQSAASTLGAVAIGRDEEVDALVRASIHDRDLSVRLAARGALVRMGRQRPELFRHFVEVIGTPGPAERRATLIDTIGRLGPSAAPAVPSLLVALREGTEEVRAGAARSLGRIGWPAAEALLPLRRAAAWDRSQRVREGADRAIKTIRRAVERRNLEIAGEAADAMASRPGRLPAGTLVGTEEEPVEAEPVEPEPEP